jgi:hypothetical protein
MTVEGATAKPRRKPRQIAFAHASLGVIAWGLFMVVLAWTGRDKWDWVGMRPKHLGIGLIALGTGGLLIAAYASMRRRADR